MKHGRVLGKLARNPIKRVRLLKNLATYLFEHESIQTTMARARELKRFSEKVHIFSPKTLDHGLTWERLVAHHISQTRH